MPKITVTEDTRSARDRAWGEAAQRFDQMAGIVAAGRDAYVRAALDAHDDRVRFQAELRRRREQEQAGAVEALRAKLLGH